MDFSRFIMVLFFVLVSITVIFRIFTGEISFKKQNQETACEWIQYNEYLKEINDAK